MAFTAQGEEVRVGGLAGGGCKKCNCGVTVTNTHNLFTNGSTYICIW